VKNKRRAVGRTRHWSLRVVQHDEGLLPRIQALKAEHPCWGYRRIWAYLGCVAQLPVHKKRLWRLMRAPHLRVPPHVRLRAKRTPTRSQPQPTKPHEWWGIDLTKVLVEGVGWVDIVIGLDGYTKAGVGHDAGLRGTAQHWLEALDLAVNRQFPQGAQGQGVSLMSDNGCQPTSMACMQACATRESQQAFTSANNPTGHADTERVMRTLQEECRWLQEWTCPLAVVAALDTWIDHDNTHDLHSALGYNTPRRFARGYVIRQSTPFVAA
jgi:transposase InsO family protein